MKFGNKAASALLQVQIPLDLGRSVENCAGNRLLRLILRQFSTQNKPKPSMAAHHLTYLPIWQARLFSGVHENSDKMPGNALIIQTNQAR
jgi:hypothetical protein